MDKPLADQALTPDRSSAPFSEGLSLARERRISFRIAAWLAAVLLAMISMTVARADGEAGLFVQDGDQVRSYCIALEGDAFTGAELLNRAGLSFDAYGGGSGLALCSIGARGCQGSGTFASCFCECQGGDCTYWGFFTKQYGKGWVYSSLAFNLLRVKDGDVHGWKWGKGGPNSAPAPREVTFEQICGHAPNGGAPPAPTIPPATQLPPAATIPAVTSTPDTRATEVSPGASPSAPAAPATTLAAPTVTVTIAGGLSSPPAATSPTTAAAFEQAPKVNGGSGGSNRTGLIAFGAIAVLLIGAISGAAAWRSRNGS